MRAARTGHEQHRGGADRFAREEMPGDGALQNDRQEDLRQPVGRAHKRRTVSTRDEAPDARQRHVPPKEAPVSLTAP